MHSALCDNPVRRWWQWRRGSACRRSSSSSSLVVIMRFHAPASPPAVTSRRRHIAGDQFIHHANIARAVRAPTTDDIAGPYGVIQQYVIFIPRLPRLPERQLPPSVPGLHAPAVASDLPFAKGCSVALVPISVNDPPSSHRLLHIRKRLRHWSPCKLKAPRCAHLF